MRPNDPLRALCVSVHDVAPATWPQCERLLEAIRAVADIPVSLLVVPAYHRLEIRDGAQYERRLEARLAAGDELVLHGYTHMDEAAPAHGPLERFVRTAYTRSEGEFLAIDAAEARRRLELGLAWFARRQWPVHGFVAPAWLLGPGAWAALAGFPFEYTTTLRRFYLLREREERLALDSQSLVYTVRSGWRRRMSCAWDSLLANMLRDAPLVRLSLHPPDIEYPEIVRHFQKQIENLLTNRQAMTKATFAESWRRSLRRQQEPGAAMRASGSAR